MKNNRSKIFNLDYSTRITKGILGYPHRKRFKDLSRVCKDIMDQRVIDVGCQDLFFDREIIPYQNIFVGCDLNWENGLLYAKENVIKHGWNHVHLIKSTGEYLPCCDGFFNTILSFETLEHVDDERRVLNEFVRISFDNAILVISAPIEFGFILLMKQFFRLLLYHDNNTYSLKEIFYAGVLCKPNKVKRYKHSHKGYDYRNTINMLIPNFKLVKKTNTPFRWLPDFLSYGTILVFSKSCDCAISDAYD
jgi:ubiquinone/menaquinone biosynthesis C-methylase UbiE